MQNLLNKILNNIKKNKLIISVVAVVLIAAGGYYFYGSSKNATGGYITNTVKKGNVTNSISATGTVKPVTTVELGFKNAETIKKIYVKEGDHVTTGQLLAEQDSTNLNAELIQTNASVKSSVAKLELLKNSTTQEELAQSEASLRTAQSTYNLAQSTFERQQALFQAGALSTYEFEQVKDSLVSAEAKLTQAQASLKTLQNGNRAEDIAAAEASVESSRAQLQMAQNDLAGVKMYSPIDGIVSAVNGAEGQRASANNNNTSGGGFISLISVALQVEAQVNEADVGSLAVGQKVEFKVNAFANKTFTGKVGSISPQAETVSNVQVYKTMIELDENQTGLKAGMPATVTIIIDRQENVLTIPKSAVTYATSYLAKAGQSGSNQTSSRTGQSSSSQVSSSRASAGNGNRGSVLILDKSGNPVACQVVLGISDQTNYVVNEGLKEGDTVVIGVSGTNSTSSSSSTSSGSSSSSNSSNRSGSSPFMGGGPPR